MASQRLPIERCISTLGAGFVAHGCDRSWSVESDCVWNTRLTGGILKQYGENCK